jgi:Ser/Thr protein kinase RdoA (MazF antagonist)
MEKRIKEIYNEQILAQALARYGIAKNNVRLLDGFESFIYEYEKGGRGYILRVSHSSRRTSGMIGGEVEWLNYLAEHGVPAARAVPSDDGQLVEVVDVGDTYFSAVSFEKALGAHPNREEWRAGLPGKLGQIMGRMHALTKRYQPSEARFKRPEWDEELEGFAEKHLPPSETKVIEKINALLAYLHTLPQDGESYGLVHTDMHGGNFFVDDGKITLFDFDDCQYAWFVYDIALALFYVLPHNCVSEKDVAWAKDFLEQFLAGYDRENRIAPEWLRQIPYFLKLREMDLYVVIHRSFDLDDLSPWCASFMDNRKYKIENDVPYVDMSFG